MPTRRDHGWLLASLLAAGLAGPADADRPLSAIDWLSQSMALPSAPSAEFLDSAAALRNGPAPEGERRPGLSPDEISVASIDAPTVDALGLLPAERAGLPRDLWGLSPADRLAEGLRALGPDMLPALQEATLAVLIAELDPPRDAEGRGALFLARLDTLIAFGALDAARALVEAAEPTRDADLFARWFDLALLAGETALPCAALGQTPDLAPGPAASIYCLGRSGDWEAAEAMLEAAPAGAITAAERLALELFLDPGESPDLPLTVPPRPTPLLWQLHDAIGEPLASLRLPLAFAHADLRADAGWRSQIEAAERLTRAGVLTPNRLLGLYTERAPAASGGVWERVAAVQRLEEALRRNDGEAAGEAFVAAWEQMREAEIEVAFARLYADRLAGLPLTGRAADTQFRAGLLTERAAEIAAAQDPADPMQAFLAGIATGTLSASGPVPPGDMPAAIRDGLVAAPTEAVAQMLDETRRGEVLLDALARLQNGGAGDPAAVAEALAALRAAGLDAVARRTALEILLLERRG